MLDETEKLATCKKCSDVFCVPKSMQFLTHCNIVTCLKCGEFHNAMVKCAPAQILAVVDGLDRPLLCPQCLDLFDVRCKVIVDGR